MSTGIEPTTDTTNIALAIGKGKHKAGMEEL